MALLEWIWGLLKRLLDFVKSILSLLANVVTSLVGWVVGFIAFVVTWAFDWIGGAINNLFRRCLKQSPRLMQESCPLLLLPIGFLTIFSHWMLRGLSSLLIGLSFFFEVVSTLDDCCSCIFDIV